MQHTNSTTFEGAIPEIGGVLGLKHEDFKQKSPSFEDFLEKVSTYAISNFKDGGDMNPLFRKMEDPFVSFKLKKILEAPKYDTDIVDKDIYK